MIPDRALRILMSISFGNHKGLTLIELMVVVAVIGIILAITIPYYTAYKRTACDRAATGDLSRISACYERLSNEMVDFGCGDGPPPDLSCFVGPYYGWGGTTRKCNVLISADWRNNVFYACALKGGRPAGPTSRYIYRQTLGGGTDLGAVTGSCVGSEYGGPGYSCYTQSMVRAGGPGGPGGPGGCLLGPPIGGVDCGSLSDF
jgi:type IV pilus assembly protein PilA